MNNQQKNMRANQARFLEAYEKLGYISKAAAAAGITSRAHYKWMAADPDYAERFDDAHLVHCETLEVEARRRAVEGVTQKVYFKGDVCGDKQVYSDQLLVVLLKGAMPDKYADRKQISGHNGGPLEIHEEIVFADGSTDEADDSGLF